MYQGHRQRGKRLPRVFEPPLDYLSPCAWLLDLFINGHIKIFWNAKVYLTHNNEQVSDVLGRILAEICLKCQKQKTERHNLKSAERYVKKSLQMRF